MQPGCPALKGRPAKPARTLGGGDRRWTVCPPSGEASGLWSWEPGVAHLTPQPRTSACPMVGRSGTPSCRNVGETASELLLEVPVGVGVREHHPAQQGQGDEDHGEDPRSTWTRAGRMQADSDRCAQ
jgi:hypothetical protein